MRKFALIIFASFVLVLAHSQIPADYYDAAQGLTGPQLKTALYNIIKGHIEYPYTASSTDVWDILKETDKDTANTDNVILLYTGWSVNAAQEYNNATGWSREHVWAKSRGDFGTALGPGTDVHHLRPCDISVNSARNNRWFDNCSEQYIDGDGPTDSFPSSTNWVWQPRDEVKGDVARMIFYMATRYVGENGEPDLVVIDSIPLDNYTNDPVHAKLSTLLEWHKADTFDAYERNRNDVIYTYQGNRNPFIDHPEYVDSIWGQEPVTGLHQVEVNPVEMYPNPASDLVWVNAPKDSVFSVYSMEGYLVLEVTESPLNLRNIKPGVYLITIVDFKGVPIANKRLIKL